MPTDVESSYSPAAVSMLEGRGYTVKGSFLTAYPPVFPLFLAGIYKVTGHSGTGNIFYPYAAALLMSFSCAFIYLIARVSFSVRAALLAAALAAGYPFFLILGVTRYAWNAMPLFLFLFYPALFLYLKSLSRGKARSFFSGFLLGSSALVWPGSSYLWLPLALVKMFRRQALLTVFFIAGFWFLSVLWQGYAFQQTGRWIWFASSNAPGMSDGMMHTSESKLRYFEFARQAAEKARQKPFESSGDILRFYENRLIQDPKGTIRFLMYKALRPWYGTDSEKFEKQTAAIQCFYLLLGLSGIWICSRKTGEVAWILILTVIYFWAVAFAVLSILRYMMPAMGLMMVFAGAAIDSLWGKPKHD